MMVFKLIVWGLGIVAIRTGVNDASCAIVAVELVLVPVLIIWFLLADIK